MAPRLCQGQCLHAERQKVGLSQYNWITLLAKARVFLGCDALGPPEIIRQELLRVRLFLLLVELDDSQFLLGESGLGVGAREAQGEVLLGEEGADAMLYTRAHVRLFELVDNAPSDTVDEVDGERAGVCLVGADHCEHGLVKELVEKVAVLPEDGRQDTGSFSGRGDGGVLRLDVYNGLRLGVDGDAPRVFGLHCSSVEAIPVNLALCLADLRVVRGSCGCGRKVHLGPQTDYLAITALRHGKEGLPMHCFIPSEVPLGYNELSIVDGLW